VLVHDVFSAVLPCSLKVQIKVLLKERLNGKSGSKSGGSQKDDDAGPSQSIELTSSNFDKLVIKSKDLWLVEFFAPWSV
jgi:protein disulfide-isomerase A6